MMGRNTEPAGRPWTVILGAAAWCVASAHAAVAADPAAFPSGTAVMFPPAEQAADVPQGAAGMTVYIDPQTGAILSEPAPRSAPLRITPQERNAASTSHLGLTQEPASVPGGGVKLDLQGRFQSPMVVTIDANGTAKVRHLDELPPGGVH